MPLRKLNEDNTPKRVWFVTGASSGLGHAIAAAALANGECVIAATRKPEQVRISFRGQEERLLIVPINLDDPRSIKSAMDAGIMRFGHIDILVNNAGGHAIGAVEDTSDQELRQVMEQNFFSMVRVIQTVLPHFRRRKAGHIFNVTSVAGFVGVMGFGAISASKFAMEGLSEALSMELAPLGIRLTIVEPVQVRTNILAESTTWIEKRSPEYEETAGETREFMLGVAGKQVNDPARIAAVLIKVADFSKPPLHLPLGKTCHLHLRGKYARLLKDVEAWQHLTLDVEFPQDIVPEPPVPIQDTADLQSRN